MDGQSHVIKRPEASLRLCMALLPYHGPAALETPPGYPHTLRGPQAHTSQEELLQAATVQKCFITDEAITHGSVALPEVAVGKMVSFKEQAGAWGGRGSGEPPACPRRGCTGREGAPRQTGRSAITSECPASLDSPPRSPRIRK